MVIHQYRIHHFAWLNYPQARDWQEWYTVACQIRDDAVPGALVMVRSAGRLAAFDEDAFRLADLLEINVGWLDGWPVVVLDSKPVQIGPVLPEDDEPVSTLSLQDAFGSERVTSERSATEVLDVPALFDERLEDRELVWYLSIGPIEELEHVEGWL